MNQGYSSYQKVQVETTNSLKLVVMLYEGAINFLEQAKMRISEDRIGEKGILINKVIAIVSELQGALNMSEGGEMAERLDSIYSYMINRLLEANANNDEKAVNEVIVHLRKLKGAWNQIAERQKSTEESRQAREEPAPATEHHAEPSPVELVG
jgi:flagellar protein FliS